MRRVFFSFHYKDVSTFRANVVRKHDLLKETGTSGFFDASIWENAKLYGADSIRNLIDKNLENTSITCVLIGSDTWQRRWVKYEIFKSYDRGNKLIGIHINGIRDKYSQTYYNGINPFENLGFFVNNLGTVDSYQEFRIGSWVTNKDILRPRRIFGSGAKNKGFKFSNWVPVYDWVEDDGFNNFASWIDALE